MSLPSYPTIAAIGENLDRINALYSPFRAKHLNPEHYEQKLKFWLKAVDDYCNVDNKSKFSIKDLELAFRANGKVSACIPDIVQYLRSQKTLMTEEEFLNSLQGQGWISWSLRPVRFVASTVWNMTPLRGFTEKKVTKETKLIYLPAISEHYTKLLSCKQLHNKVMLKSEWITELAKVVDSEEVELYTMYLISTGHLHVDVIGEDKQIVKFVHPLKSESGISNAEKVRFDLTRTKERLEKDLDSISEQQTLCIEAAKKSLKEKQRTKAKYHLRCKNTLEKRAEKLHTLISNLTEVMFQIEDAESDAMVISAYETGKNALTKVLKDSNVTVDRATEAMLELEEALEDQAEISSTIHRSIAPEDDPSLEDELNDLLEADKAAGLKELPVADKTAAKDRSELEEQLGRLKDLSLADLNSLEDNTRNKSLSQTQ